MPPPPPLFLCLGGRGNLLSGNAAGTGQSDSRRLPYTSKNQVESRGLPRTSVETVDCDKHRPINALAPEVQHHHGVS